MSDDTKPETQHKQKEGRVSVADLQRSAAGSRYEWLACGTPLSCRRQKRSQICYRDGVDVYPVSNVEIGFPLCRYWKLS